MLFVIGSIFMQKAELQLGCYGTLKHVRKVTWVIIPNNHVFELQVIYPFPRVQCM
jgi:hypothetical protein